MPYTHTAWEGEIPPHPWIPIHWWRGQAVGLVRTQILDPCVWRCIPHAVAALGSRRVCRVCRPCPEVHACRVWECITPSGTSNDDINTPRRISRLRHRPHPHAKPKSPHTRVWVPGSRHHAHTTLYTPSPHSPHTPHPTAMPVSATHTASPVGRRLSHLHAG